MYQEIKPIFYVIFYITLLFVSIRILDKILDMKERIAKLEVKVEKLEEKE